MAKKIVQPVEVQASVKGDESVKSFRAQLREAKEEALRLAEAFGETDARTVAAAQKVANLKDRMDDLNHTISGLHPDRFERIATITGTLANGFAAAQGAAALLGGESEELQKQMVRVQGAMALSQGIAGMKDMGKQIAGLAGDAKRMLIPAFTSVAGAARAIGAALGIGIIIAGITALIALVQKLDISLDGVSKSDKKLLESQQARLKASQDQVDALDASDNILKLQGKSEKEILQMKIAALKVVIDNQKAVIETSKAQATAQIAASQRNKDILVGILNFITAPLRLLLNTVDAVASKLGYETGLLKGFEDMVDSVSKLAFDPAETKKQADEDLKEMQDGLRAMENTMAGHELALRAIGKNGAKERKQDRKDEAKQEIIDEAKLAEERLRRAKQAHDDEMNGIKQFYSERELEAMKAAKTMDEFEKAQAQIRIDRLNNEIQARRDAGLSTVEQEKELEEIRLKNAKTAADATKANRDKEKKDAEEDLKRQKELAQNKIDLAVGATQSMFDLVNALTTNNNAKTEAERKREFQRAKAFQIAQTMVSTFAAAQQAYQSQMQFTPDSPIRAAIAAATAVASGLARVAAIKKQQYTPGGQGSPAPSSPGGGGIQRPSLPSSSTLGGGTQMAGEWNTRVFVTEGDITGTQRRVNMLRGASVI